MLLLCYANESLWDFMTTRRFYSWIILLPDRLLGKSKFYCLPYSPDFYTDICLDTTYLIADPSQKGGQLNTYY